MIEKRMHNFNITIYNQKEKRWQTKSVEKYSFAEAAGAAYRMRNKLGFDWEIQCVVKIVQDNLENNE